ncbi:MAG: hypothetical protein DRN35_00880 [Thermoplasmata archaeon]|nr:MAG: hypothetical protein DRN35_00880 [Thermoplasmata archaeon]RLF74287.1 MAG: hypothetical protein DRN55_00770 [Thermoplasmata archaeon]HDD60779.1 hypothetical protein [Euryarchaeota archaeon]
MERKVAERRLLESAYAGEIVGSTVLKDYNKVAVITESGRGPAALASSVMASFLATNPRGNIRVYLHKEEEVEKIIEEVIEYEPSAILLLFQCDDEDSIGAFMEMLRRLAENMVEVDLILHSTCVESGALKEAIEEEKVGEYLSQMPAFTYSLEEKKGYMLLKEIYFEESVLELEGLEEYPLKYPFVELLKEQGES